MKFLIPIVLSCTDYGAHASHRRNVINYIPDPRGTKTPVQRRISLDYVWLISRSAFLLLVCLASPAAWHSTSIFFSLLTNSQARAIRKSDCPCRYITWEGKCESTSKNKLNLGRSITYFNTSDLFAHTSVTWC